MSQLAPGTQRCPTDPAPPPAAAPPAPFPGPPCFHITQGPSWFFRANPLITWLGFGFMATEGVEPPDQMVIC